MYQGEQGVTHVSMPAEGESLPRVEPESRTRDNNVKEKR